MGFACSITASSFRFGPTWWLVLTSGGPVGSSVWPTDKAEEEELDSVEAVTAAASCALSPAAGMRSTAASCALSPAAGMASTAAAATAAAATVGLAVAASSPAPHGIPH
jgi:hypothetical protein